MQAGTDVDRFSRGRWRRGYDVDEVDAFIERIELTMAGRARYPVTLEELYSVQFTVVRGGYATDEVATFLEHVRGQLRLYVGTAPGSTRSGAATPAGPAGTANASGTPGTPGTGGTGGTAAAMLGPARQTSPAAGAPPTTGSPPADSNGANAPGGAAGQSSARSEGVFADELVPPVTFPGGLVDDDGWNGHALGIPLDTRPLSPAESSPAQPSPAQPSPAQPCPAEMRAGDDRGPSARTAPGTEPDSGPEAGTAAATPGAPNAQTATLKSATPPTAPPPTAPPPTAAPPTEPTAPASSPTGQAPPTSPAEQTQPATEPAVPASGSAAGVLAWPPVPPRRTDAAPSQPPTQAPGQPPPTAPSPTAPPLAPPEPVAAPEPPAEPPASAMDPDEGATLLAALAFANVVLGHRGARFPRRPERGLGYNVANVDDFVDQVGATLNTSLTVAEVRSVVFGSERGGYDDGAVDQWLEQVVDRIVRRS